MVLTDLGKVFLGLKKDIDKVLNEATLSGDIIGVPASEAYKVDWASGKGAETNLGKIYLKNKKEKILRRTMNKIQKI